MSEEFKKTAEQISAFQKIWTESMSRVMQAAFTTAPGTPPPELLKQIRSGIFQALAHSWEEFMRTPQFTESMKHWMDNAIHFRQISNDFMSKVRNEMQAASSEDIDQVLLSVQHMEKRLLDSIDQLAAEVAAVSGRPGKRARKNGKSTRRNQKTKVSV